MSNQWDDLPDQPILEEPDAVESPEAGAGTLFQENVSVMASRLSVSESLLKLLTSDLKFSDFIREILIVIMRAVKSEAGSVLEVDHKENTLFFRTAAGAASDRVVKFVLPMGQGIAGHVAESKQPLVVSNMKENEQHLKAISNAIGFEARNLIAVPIVVRGKTYGVLELLNRIGEDDYTEQDQELVVQLCEQASKAIEIRLMLNWAGKGPGREAA